MALGALAGAGRPMTAFELGRKGIPRMTLKRLQKTGLIERVARGIYKLAGSDENSWTLWAAVSLRNPKAVFCLNSAASYHGIIENMAANLNIAVPKAARKPTEELTGGMSARFLKWSDTSMEKGVSTVVIDGVGVKITDPARTVVDMFRYSSLAISPATPLIDPATFHDTFSRYMQKDGFDVGSRNLRKAAKVYGIWDQMNPIVEMFALSYEKGPSF